MVTDYRMTTDFYLTGRQRVASAFSHAGCFLGMPFLVPLGIWFFFPRMFEDPNDYVREQSVQAMLFHLIVLVVFGALWGATFGLFIILVGGVLWGVSYGQFGIVSNGWPIVIIVGLVAGAFTIWSTIVMLIAVVKAALGQPYRLPFVGGRSIA